MVALTELYFIPTQTLNLGEWPIYGSSRVGIYKANKTLAVVEDNVITASTYQTRIKFRYNGKKQYELSNHLGNVLVTISDRRKAICNNVDSTLGYNAVVITANDYYSFGSVMIGREFVADTVGKYRYGFNGAEKDNEIKGDGNSLEFKFRIYGPRLGKFLSIDPLTKSYPYYSPYHFAGNRPIDCIDLEGTEPKSVVKQSSHGETIMIPYDLPSKRQRLKITVVDYKFTEAATHLLSLVSGISASEINKVDINNAKGSVLPAYDPKEGGGAMTLPTGNSNQYDMNFTDNFFNQKQAGKYGSADNSNDVIGWLDLTSHEVGHIKDIQEIGNNRIKYMATFGIGYAKSSGHDGYWRESRADIGQTEFRNFNSFVDSYYGKGKMQALFEKKNNTDKDIIGRLDQWWGQYQEQQQNNSSKTSTGN